MLERFHTIFLSDSAKVNLLNKTHKTISANQGGKVLYKPLIERWSEILTHLELGELEATV